MYNYLNNTILTPSQSQSCSKETKSYTTCGSGSISQSLNEYIDKLETVGRIASTGNASHGGDMANILSVQELQKGFKSIGEAIKHGGLSLVGLCKEAAELSKDQFREWEKKNVPFNLQKRLLKAADGWHFYEAFKIMFNEGYFYLTDRLEKLSVLAFPVAKMLTYYANKYDKFVNLSWKRKISFLKQNNIGLSSLITKKNVMVILNAMVKFGLIFKKRRFKETNVYFLQVPKHIWEKVRRKVLRISAYTKWKKKKEELKQKMVEVKESILENFEQKLSEEQFDKMLKETYLADKELTEKLAKMCKEDPTYPPNAHYSSAGG